MILKNYRITHILSCLADPNKIRGYGGLGEKIHEYFFHLNGLLKGCINNRPAMILTLKKDGKIRSGRPI